MLPAVFTFYLGLVDQLGADPQKTLERTLGLWALRFLILTLAITRCVGSVSPIWCATGVLSACLPSTMRRCT
jgi:DMSO/TMAO reductase YedYZ heme-binding membrane subunit